MKNDRYCMAFSTGGLFLHESVMLAELYILHRQWDLVRAQAFSRNLLQTRTLTSAQRVYREVSARLKTLHPDELAILVQGSPPEQAQMAWVSVCRRFAFIAEFAVEVLREHFVSLKTTIVPADFDFFFSRKAEWHPELDQITPSTRKKLRQVLFRMMREATLVNPDGTINAPLLTPRLVGAISRERRPDLLFFPSFD